LRTLGGYFSLSFLLSLVLGVVIGFQLHIRNSFLKGLFHAYISGICMVVASSIIIPFFWDWRISDVIFCMSVALGGLGSNTMEFMLVVGLFWIVFLLLLGLALWVIRKSGNRGLRIWGQVLAILVFAAVLALCHYHIVRAIGTAIAIASMYR
jgi:hypothetical protein